MAPQASPTDACAIASGMTLARAASMIDRTRAGSRCGGDTWQ
jgi:hypothetical protein